MCTIASTQNKINVFQMMSEDLNNNLKFTIKTLYDYAVKHAYN